MVDDISIKRITYGTWGGVATSTTTSYHGRFEFKSKLVRNIQGEEVVAIAQVYLPIIELQHKDIIGYNGNEYHIISIEVKKDFSDNYLLVNVT